MQKALFILAFLVALLPACSAPVPAPAQAPTQVPATRVPDTSTPSPTPLPTETPLPPTKTSTPVVTPTLAAYGPENFPDEVNPLTGLPVGDSSLLDRRPMAVKIQLFPRGQRPPWGISAADLVFDYYQNNGISRLNAVFYGENAEKVGPIRSARLFDSHVIRMYKAILAFGGADARILNRFYGTEFANRLIFEGANNCQPMCRQDPNGNNFLITNIGELSKYATSLGIENERQNLDGMSFDPEIPDGGQPVSKIYTRFSISAYARWDYDAQSGRYLRFQDAQEAGDGAGEDYAPLVDNLTNEQISAANVVVLYVPHQYFFRSGNSEIVEMLMTGSGEAIAFRDGQAYQVKWNRPENDSTLSLSFSDGTAYAFKPGNTWFEVMGTSSQRTEEQNDAWRFQFSIP